MKIADGNKRKILEIIREELKEELGEWTRAHRRVILHERNEVKRISLLEVERFKKRKPSCILSVLRGLSWVS